MMPKTMPVLISFFIFFILYSCSKKVHPARTETAVVNTDTLMAKASDSVSLIKKIDSLAVNKKPVVKRKPKEIIPTVIAVNDNVAKKSVDGRLYYDLQGHRYWRSNKDGKYYLFNKSMQSDPAFNKPQ